MGVDAEDIIRRFISRRLAVPIIRNDLRGEIVEEIVGLALEPEWTHCGGDWGPADFTQESSGLNLQVKQSAARQSWDAGERGRAPPRFSIARKTGRWDGATWTAEISRNAEIFVFAWHPLTDDRCDHRDPYQWQFFVVAETDLPANASIGLGTLFKTASLIGFADLATTVRVQVNRLRDSHG